MRLIRTGKNRFTFRLRKQEKPLLLQILQLYPLVPDAHHRLRRGENGARPDDQKLLEEAVAEHRRENRAQVLAILEGEGRLSETKSGVRLSLSLSEIECLLQVLNDLRVGAWLALGEPEEMDISEVDDNNMIFFATMHVAGQFQAELLSALGVDNPVQPGDS